MGALPFAPGCRAQGHAGEDRVAGIITIGSRMVARSPRAFSRMPPMRDKCGWAVHWLAD